MYRLVSFTVKKVDKMEQELDNANDLLAAARKKGKYARFLAFFLL